MKKLDNCSIHQEIFNNNKKECYFNWSIKKFQIGFHLSLCSEGIDFYLGFWASIHGTILFRKTK